MKPLIICCGNPDRGDDGAGLVAARRLRELGHSVLDLAGEAASLLDAWEDQEEVILIDAVITGAAPGSLHIWDPPTAPLSAGAFRCSTHNFGVGEAIRLAGALNRMPPRLTIYGIEAARFELGSAISPAVSNGAEEAANRLHQYLGRP